MQYPDLLDGFCLDRLFAINYLIRPDLDASLVGISGRYE